MSVQSDVGFDDFCCAFLGELDHLLERCDVSSLRGKSNGGPLVYLRVFALWPSVKFCLDNEP